MTKRSDTVEAVLLALELLRRIPRQRKVTAKDLHVQLQAAGIARNLRTIQRQLDMLCQHFDIERDDRSKPYGYRWLPHGEPLAVANLSPQESLLLNLAEAQLKHLLPAQLTRAMNGFFAQARRNLSQEQSAALARQWPDKVRVVATSQPLLPPKLRAGVFDAVSEALYENRWLNVDYQNASGKGSNARIMPLGLAQQGERLYLVCRFEGYDNERSLALHRIQSAKVSMATFERPRDFDLKRYDDDGRFGFGEGQRIKLSFTIDANAGQHLTESPLSQDQAVKVLRNGRLQITATVVNSAMLDRWLLGFGETVRGVRKHAIET